LFSELNKKDGITIVMVTHEREIGEYANRIINIRDGLVSEEEVLR
jgi:putative ABC transport system ATP-binding protein